MKWKPYPKYQESGVEWLGNVPEQWRIGSVRRFAKLESGHTPSRQHPEYWENCMIPWFTLADVWQLRDDRTEMVSETKECISEVGLTNSSARLLPAGTVMLSRTASVGFSGIMGVPMATTQDFANWVCRRNLLPAYLLYCLRAMRSDFGRLMYGSTHNTIYMPDVQKLCTCVPSIAEQAGIVDWIRGQTAKIDSLIAKQERLIELLQEKRQALISHVVTKGLNPDAPMKPSGVEWLGDVPAHWRMVRLKNVASLQSGLTLGKDYSNRQLERRPYLRVANVQDGFLDLTTITEIDVPRDDAGRYELQSGDVLMTEGGDFDKLGRGFVWFGQIQGCLHQNHIFAIRLRVRTLNPLFLARLMTAGHGKAHFTSTSQQTTNLASTNSTKILGFPIPLPPYPEQLEIIAALERDTAIIDGMIQKAQRSIALMREHRTALISAAVTGKIDVRAPNHA